jgi:hypothetical protein
MIAMELKLITCASAIAIGVGVAPLTGRSRPRLRPAGAALRAPRGLPRTRRRWAQRVGRTSTTTGPWIHLTPTIRVFVSGTSGKSEPATVRGGKDGAGCSLGLRRNDVGHFHLGVEPRRSGVSVRLWRVHPESGRGGRVHRASPHRVGRDDRGHRDGLQREWQFGTGRLGDAGAVRRGVFTRRPLGVRRARSAHGPPHRVPRSLVAQFRLADDGRQCRDDGGSSARCRCQCARPPTNRPVRRDQAGGERSGGIDD